MKKFLRVFTFGLCLYVLLLAGQTGMLGGFSETGPKLAYANPFDIPGVNPVPDQPSMIDQPPVACSTSCPSGKTGSCGGHQYWIWAEQRYGDCQCETEAQTCSVPQQPQQQCPNPDQYPQCGGTCNGVTYSNTTKLWVEKRIDQSSCSISWNCAVVENNSRECGYTAVASQPTQTTRTTTSTTFVNKCEGKADKESTCRNGKTMVCRCFSDGCDFEDTGSACGISSTPTQSAPQTQPVQQLQQQQQQQQQQQVIVQQPAASQPAQVVCPPGTFLSGGTCRAQVVCPAGTQLVVNSAGFVCLPPQGQIASNSNTNNNSNSNVNTVTVSAPAAQTATTTTVKFADVALCPDGFSKKVEGNVVTCTAPAPKVVLTAAGVETKELPKTGLPILFWAASAFLPLGLGMQRFKKGVRANWSNPQYLWEDRQFKV